MKTMTVHHVARPGHPPVPRTLYLCPDGSYRRLKELRRFRAGGDLAVTR